MEHTVWHLDKVKYQVQEHRRTLTSNVPFRVIFKSIKQFTAGFVETKWPILQTRDSIVTDDEGRPIQCEYWMRPIRL
jgi:hypothetical protein